MTTRTRLVIHDCAILAGLADSALTSTEPQIKGIVGILLLGTGRRAVPEAVPDPRILACCLLK